MDEINYKIQLQSVFNLAALVRQLRLAELLEAMNRSEAIGPIVDPSLYLNASRNLAWQKNVVEAALTFQQAVEKIIEAAS